MLVELKLLHVDFVQNNAEELVSYRVLLRQSRADGATGRRSPGDDEDKGIYCGRHAARVNHRPDGWEIDHDIFKGLIAALQ